MFNAQLIKKDFPILDRIINGQPLVYLDSAATSQKPHEVINAISSYYSQYNANVHRGIYTLSEESTAAYEGTRKKVKHFLNASCRKEIIFTSGTTESINLVAFTWARQNLQKGDVILVTDMEHHSNYVPWFRLEEEMGVVRKFITFDEDGILNLDEYEKVFEEGNVKLVCLPHVSNVLGTINPVKEITAMAHKYGAIVLVDGAQAVPHLKVDLKDLDCDFYAFSSHKMLGPTGVGVLYGKKEILEKMAPFKGGGDMILSVHKNNIVYNDIPWRFEAGTPNIAGVIGLSAAIDYLSKIGIEKIHHHEEVLIKKAYVKIQEEFGPQVQLYGPDPHQFPQARAGVFAFQIKGIHPHDVASILNDDNICIRAGHHCAQPLIDVLGVTALTRGSFYLYNTEEDIDALVDGIKKVINIFS